MRSRLSLLFVLPALAGAALVPAAFAPHEANACSGAGSTSPAFRRNPTITNATAVELDTIQLTTGNAQSSSLNNAQIPILHAHIETSLGAVVALSRNDVESHPPQLFGTETSILRPVLPLLPNTSYVLVLDNIVDATQSAVETRSLPFTTGAALHSVPPSPDAHVSGDMAEVIADIMPVCCERCSTFGCEVRCETSCAATHIASRGWQKVSWTAPTAPGVTVRVEVESTRVADELGWTTEAGKRVPTADLTGVTSLYVPLASGEHACVRVFAVDSITGDRSPATPLCFDGPPLPANPPVLMCDSLTTLAADTSCVPSTEMTAALAVCDAPVGAGGSGGGGTGECSAGSSGYLGSGEAGASPGGSAGAGPTGAGAAPPGCGDGGGGAAGYGAGGFAGSLGGFPGSAGGGSGSTGQSAGNAGASAGQAGASTGQAGASSGQAGGAGGPAGGSGGPAGGASAQAGGASTGGAGESAAGSGGGLVAGAGGTLAGGAGSGGELVAGAGGMVAGAAGASGSGNDLAAGTGGTAAGSRGAVAGGAGTSAPGPGTGAATPDQNSPAAEGCSFGIGASSTTGALGIGLAALALAKRRRGARGRSGQAHLPNRRGRQRQSVRAAALDRRPSTQKKTG
jgi:hypothetical protein